MIKAFEDKKLCMVSRSLEELRDLLFKEMEGPEGGFNEAQRAAMWILERWET
jgi:hypothetical protein